MHPELEKLIKRYRRGECSPNLISLLKLELEIHMSAQLDQLIAAQTATTAAIAGLTAAIANQPKPDDLTAAIATETTTATAINAITSSLAPAAQGQTPPA